MPVTTSAGIPLLRVRVPVGPLGYQTCKKGLKLYYIILYFKICTALRVGPQRVENIRHDGENLPIVLKTLKLHEDEEGKPSPLHKNTRARGGKSPCCAKNSLWVVRLIND